jgi:integrase
MQVSTKQTDKRLAQAAAAEFERASRLARHGELAEAQARKIVSDLMARAGGGETLRSVTTEDHFRQWLAGKETNRSAGTARRYAPIVDGFLASLGTRATKPLASLAPGDVDRYVTELGRRGLSGRTIGLHVTAIRTALNYARRQGTIPTNPAEAIERPAAVEHTKGTFTEAELAMLASAAEGEWRTLILVGNFTGLRLGDCAKLEWRGVDLTAGTLTTTMQKTGKKVTLPLHPDLLAHLEKLAGTDAPDTFVLPTLANQHHGGRMGLSRSFLELMRQAGLAAEDASGNKRSFHSLRHGFTSRLANAGIAPELRMKLTGHTSAKVHAGYTHHEMQNLAAAVGKLASLPPLP